MVAMVHCSPMGVEGRPEKYSTNQPKSAINDGQERPFEPWPNPDRSGKSHGPLCWCYVLAVSSCKSQFGPLCANK